MVYVANNPELFASNTPVENVDLSQTAPSSNQMTSTSNIFYTPLDSGDQTIPFPDSTIIIDSSTVSDSIEVD
ncbi:MAG: hypothetical protein P8X73_03805 [Ignavibacteriaceae bacterium]